jgi:hypothetical protein
VSSDLLDREHGWIEQGLYVEGYLH